MGTKGNYRNEILAKQSIVKYRVSSETVNAFVLGTLQLTGQLQKMCYIFFKIPVAMQFVKQPSFYSYVHFRPI